ncbi:MAG: hypothetical protein ACI4QN_03155 [Candidatus Coproplasma sp.]
MKFEMWSVWHYLLMIAPILIMTVLFLVLRKKSYKVRYIVGVIIGVISLCILLARNISMLLNEGFSPGVIPLQVCHFGNIMVFIALVFRSKTATSIAWCLNMIAAFSSLIVADDLAGYITILEVRPQAYIWGHIFIVVGALYAVIMKIVRIDLKSFFIGVGVLFALLIPAIILNSYFTDVCGYECNYFYIYNSEGVPFEPLYIGERAQYGWFTINWIYTVLVIVIAFAVMFGFFLIQKLFYLKDNDYKTYNVFTAAKMKKHSA